MSGSNVGRQPILYYSNLSSASRSVLLTAEAIGIELNLKEINLYKGEHLTEKFVKMNPQHTIPLLNDNGVVVYDSHAICCYLCDKYAMCDRFYPKELGKRALVNARLHFNSGFLICRTRWLCEPILYSDSTEIGRDKIEYIEKCWIIMEAFLKNSRYLCGNDLTIADFCCVSTITSCDGITPIDSERYPNLTDWMERMTELPYYQRMNGDGADESKEIFWSKLKENQYKN